MRFLNKFYTLLCLLILSASMSFAQKTYTLCSWNVQNLGKSKSETELAFMAKTLKNMDLVAIQEVVASPFGPQAVAKLADELNRTGAKWDYIISDPTSGSNIYESERYAFLWKTARVKVAKKAFLEPHYAQQISREPYCFPFQLGAKHYLLMSFHALPKNKQPEQEIKYLKFLPDAYKNEAVIFCGDFNTPQSHNVFGPLKQMGYLPAMQGQKTTLRQKLINNDPLASEYDNFYFKRSQVTMLKAGIVPFYESFPDLKTARHISDHLPIFLEIKAE